MLRQGTEGGGAAIGQVIGMSVVALIIGGLAVLDRLPAPQRARSPGSTASPSTPAASSSGRRGSRCRIALFIATLICALFGFIWDVSLHIGKGRDPGPLANPAHYFILFGLFLLFVAGCAGDRPAVREAGPVRGPHHQRLVRPGRRCPDGRLRPVRADRLPARRRLAPHLRPGRHAVGAHAPDDDRRRRASRRSPRCSSNTRATGAMGDDTPKDGLCPQVRPVPRLRRHHHRPFGVPDRVRLRRARSSVRCSSRC